MRYIKSYKIFENEQYHDKIGRLFRENFGISKDEIYDLLDDVSDEFGEIDYWVSDAKESWLVESNEDIFVIYFESSKPAWEAENLYDLENYLISSGKLNQIKSYLKDYGLEVYASDYGESDTQYEIVICKKGTHVVQGDAYFKRYSGH